jgi:hypothetical protein
MIKIPPEELVRYLYNETSEQETATIEAALQTDWNLFEIFEKLLIAQQILNEVNLSPEPQAVNKIMKYASKKQ